MAFKESFYDAAVRIRMHGPRPPCISLREFARKVGLSYQKLAWLIRSSGGPSPELRTRKDIWFKGKDLVAWWEALT